MPDQKKEFDFSEAEREAARRELQRYSLQGFKIQERKTQQNVFETIDIIADDISMKTAPLFQADLMNLLTVDVTPRSRVPFFGKLICLSKRLARRWLMWYLGPVFERQSMVNRLLFEQIRRNDKSHWAG